jgi:hypothetical protein
MKWIITLLLLINFVHGFHYDNHYVVVICRDRPRQVDKVLKSLTDGSVRHSVPLSIVVSQSGDDKATHDTVMKYSDKITFFQNINNITDGNTRLAEHFKWSFDNVFDYFDDPHGLIVIEDDLRLAPDFFEYFEYTIPIQEIDPSIAAISAWNDNGFVTHSRNKHRIKRTSFFPGLGWYLARERWREWGPGWPDKNWDYHLRQDNIMLKRDILYPEVPRSYHATSTGTFMYKGLFNSLFKNIKLQNDPNFRWEWPKDFERLTEFDYTRDVIKMLRTGHQLIHARELLKVTDIHVVIWIENPGKSVSRMFKLWEEQQRGEWRGIRTFWSEKINGYIFLIDVTNNPQWLVYRDPKSTIFTKSIYD